MVPIFCDAINPKSVVDVGCGIGPWLREFQRHGVDRIFGIDGPWIDKSQLLIPSENLAITNLEEPIHLSETFDLVVSLEVAEHLQKSSAPIFVDSLRHLGPVILFSAAIPFQGGANHLNEQWPEYWANLFAGQGYKVVDCIRKQVWSNQDVDPYYAQNILLFVREDRVKDYPNLEAQI